MPSQNRVLTPEQLALSEARKRKKAEAAAAAAIAAALNGSSPVAPPSIVQRAFLSKRTPDLRESPYQLVIMTWNVGRTTPLLKLNLD